MLRRDSGILELYYRRITAVRQCKPLRGSLSKNSICFKFYRALSCSQHLVFFKFDLISEHLFFFSNSTKHLVALRANVVLKYCLNKKILQSFLAANCWPKSLRTLGMRLHVTVIELMTL